MKKIFTFSLVLALFFSTQALAVEEKKSETSEAVVTTSASVTFEKKAAALFLRGKETLESFRIAQAARYAKLRDTTKIKLGIQVADDVFKELSDAFSQPPAPAPLPGTEAGDGLTVKKLDNPALYGLLVFYTSLASLFASPLMFYAVVAFVAFFVIRFLIRSFI